MTYYLKLYAVALVVFLVLDAIWLGLIARGFYAKHLGYVLSAHPQWWAALLFYLIFVTGALVFVIIPGIGRGALGVTLLHAALFGLVTYATYDLTNLATIKDWPGIVTIVDLIWGTALSTVVCAAGVAVGKWLGG